MNPDEPRQRFTGPLDDDVEVTEDLPMNTFDVDAEESALLGKKQNPTPPVQIPIQKKPEVPQAPIQPPIRPQQIPLQKTYIPPVATKQWVPPAPQTTSPTPPPTIQSTQPVSKFDAQKVIRTYESDVAQAIEKKRASVMTIAIAENMAKSKGESIGTIDHPHYGRKIFSFLLGLIFILAGVGGAYYFYLNSPLAPVTIKPITKLIPSVVAPDNQRMIDATKLSGPTLIGAIRGAEQAEQDRILTEFIFTIKSATSTSRMLALDLFTSLGITPPDILTRSFTDPWMYGVYNGELQSPFIILTTDFYQNAFSGMLRWEGTIADDLAQLFNYPTSVERASSSTTDITRYFGIRGTFEDAIIRNKDVRIFKANTGERLFMYAFLDKNTLIITPNENVIREVVDRIEKRTYVR